MRIGGCAFCANAPLATRAAHAAAAMPRMIRWTIDIEYSSQWYRVAVLCGFGLLVIDDEIVRDRRPPDVERIFRWMIGGGPVDRFADEVDVERILGPASPRVLHIIKIVRAEYVATDTPALVVALRFHQLGAETDV